MGSELFYGCSELNAVVWDIDLPLTAEMFDAASYYNLLAFVKDGSEFSHPLMEAGRMTLVEGEKAAALQLYGNKSFYCPRAFVVEEVSYQRTFTQSTGLGLAEGWETIVLPFDVQRFTHSSKGDIAPFGSPNPKCVPYTPLSYSSASLPVQAHLPPRPPLPYG